MSELINLKSTDELKRNLQTEKENRRTISFYKYHKIENTQEFRDKLFKNLSELNVLGRIYVAAEGINAQISVPEKDLQNFVDYLSSYEFLRNIRLNIALEDDGKSFWKLIIRVRQKIVADGIDDESFSVENKGEYLNAEEFNKLTENPETVVVDMRNYYEFEVGHFENAREIPADTFREQLPLAAEMLANKKDTPIVMYCTGGIRCEKASAYLRYKGFKEVYHLEGGIIEYVRKVQENKLENKFKGKNFVFDARMGERITNDILSNCHQCGELCDTHRNCENLGCHLLFIQCDKCFEQFDGCCTPECQEIIKLSEDKQKEIRQNEKSKIFSNSQKLRKAKVKR
ncbi:MAG: rhodanese-related sulfurtransferase [Aridibacter sp.]